MKKVLASALIVSFCLGVVNSTAFAIGEKSGAQPKQFKMMASTNKKIGTPNKFDYLNIEWWDNFNDPLLTDYIVKAVENNHDLKIATLNVEQYYQNVKMQFADELPQAGFGFAPNYIKQPGTSNADWNFILPGLVSYEADIFLKNRDKTKAQRKLFESAVYDERAAYISVVSAVGTTYLNIVKLDKTIEIQEELVNSRQKIYDLMLLRNREGITSTADTIKANKALISGQTNLIELKKQREKLLNRFAVLIGESPANASSIKRTSLDELNFNSTVPTEISSEVIVNRPDYLKAEKLVEKAGLDVRVAKKEFLPTITLSGLAFFNAANFGSLLTTKNMLWALGGGSIVPLSTGGKRIFYLKYKKAEYDRAVQNYYKTNLAAIQEVNDALVTVKLDKEKMEQTLKQSDLEAKDYRYNELKFEEGVISKLDLIQHKENLLTIDKLVAQQKAECMIDYIGLYKAVGSDL